MTDQHQRSGPHLDLDALTGYVDGSLTSTERANVDAHLSTCAMCLAELAGLQATVELLHGLPQFSPSVSFQLGEEHAQTARSSPSNIVRLLPIVRALSVAAVLLFMVVSGATLFDLGSNSGNSNSAMDMVSAPGASDTGIATGTESDQPTSVSAEDSSSGTERRSLLPQSTSTDEAIGGDASESAADAQAAPAMAESIGQATVESVATPEPIIEVVHESETVDNSDENGRSYWVAASIVLGFLTIVLIGIWILLTRLSRHRRSG